MQVTDHMIRGPQRFMSRTSWLRPKANVAPLACVCRRTRGNSSTKVSNHAQQIFTQAARTKVRQRGAFVKIAHSSRQTLLRASPIASSKNLLAAPRLKAAQNQEK